MLHTKVVKQIWRVFGQAQVDLFSTQETAQCPLWYSVRFSPDRSAPGSSGEVSLLLVAPFWPGEYGSRT